MGWVREITSKSRVTFGGLFSTLATLGTLYALYLGDMQVALGGLFFAAVGGAIARSGMRIKWYKDRDTLL